MMALGRKAVLLALLACCLLALSSAGEPSHENGGGRHGHAGDGDHGHAGGGKHGHHGDGQHDEDVSDTSDSESESNKLGNVVETEGKLVEEDLEDKMGRFFQSSKNKLSKAIYNLSGYLPINVKYAAGVAHKCDIVQYNRHYYSKAGLVISGVMLVTGVLFAFVGYRFMKLVLFLIGFFGGGAISYFIVLAFTSDLQQTWIPYAAVGGAIVVGIICGALTICVYYVGIFLAGAGIGFLIMWFILAAINITYFQVHIWIPVLIAAAAAVVVGIVTLFIQKWFFMVGTSVLGALKIVWAIDYAVELGSMIYYLLLFAESRAELRPCWYSWCMIPLFVVLALAGFIIQALLTGRKYDHRKDFNGVCCGMCSKKRRKTVDGSGDYMDLKKMDED